MTASTITSQAYAKLILHAAKYPSLSVFGVLLGPTAGSITDVVPVTHDFVALSSFLEAALEQVKIHAARSQKRIIGLYIANQLLEDVSVGPLAGKVGAEIDTLAGGNSVLLVINNAKLLDQESDLNLLTFKYNQPNKIFVQTQQNGITLSVDKESKSVWDTIKSVQTAIEKNKQSVLYDFSNHLDDPSLDWLVNGEVVDAWKKE
ncbi:UNVERIFIED_CONTAM: ER membrane protein complex subunit 8 [Siphonaria sp. JEL0065]|nr:ER membrane protein complex subunit 8 [Siphonaria sp. JEL0065]